MNLIDLATPPAADASRPVSGSMTGVDAASQATGEFFGDALLGSLPVAKGMLAHAGGEPPPRQKHREDPDFAAGIVELLSLQLRLPALLVPECSPAPAAIPSLPESVSEASPVTAGRGPVLPPALRYPESPSAEVPVPAPGLVTAAADRREDTSRGPAPARENSVAQAIVTPDERLRETPAPAQGTVASGVTAPGDPVALVWGSAPQFTLLRGDIGSGSGPLPVTPGIAAQPPLAQVSHAGSDAHRVLPEAGQLHSPIRQRSAPTVSAHGDESTLTVRPQPKARAEVSVPQSGSRLASARMPVLEIPLTGSGAEGRQNIAASAMVQPPLPSVPAAEAPQKLLDALLLTSRMPVHTIQLVAPANGAERIAAPLLSRGQPSTQEPGIPALPGGGQPTPEGAPSLRIAENRPPSPAASPRRALAEELAARPESTALQQPLRDAASARVKQTPSAGAAFVPVASASVSLPAGQLAAVSPEGPVLLTAPSLQAASGSVAAAVPTPQTAQSVKLEVDQSLWSQQLKSALGTRLQLQFKDQIQHATIRLDPPEMGKIDIALKLEGGRVEVQIGASHAEVYRALQQTSGDLRQSLAGSHFAQVSVQVSSQSGQHHQGKGQPADEQAHAAIAAGSEAADGKRDARYRQDDSVLLTV